MRVDSALKTDAEKCLTDMEMTKSTAINIYLRQIVRNRAIPFIISSAPISNIETMEAIAEGEKTAHDPNVPGYRDMKSLRKALK